MPRRYYVPQFDCRRLAADMAVRGWNKSELARRAKVSGTAVQRFFNGQQTAKMAQKFATALGYSVRRYFVRIKAVA